MKEFSAMGSLRMSYEGSEIANLALTGADEAVASMLNCQAAMSKAEVPEGTQKDPFAPKPDPI